MPVFYRQADAKIRTLRNTIQKNVRLFFKGKNPAKRSAEKKTADQKVGQDIKHRAKLTASGKAGAKVDNLGIQSKYKGRKIERK